MTHPVGADARPDVGTSLSTLLRALARTRERLRLHGAPFGLDWSGFTVLRPLVEDGPARVTALAGVVHLAPSTVSRLVAHLIERGLLERRPDPADGRATIVAPTARGQAAYAALRRVHDEHLDNLLRDWRPEERDELARVLARLAAALEENLPAPPGAAPPGPGPPGPTTHGPTSSLSDLAVMGSS